MKRLSAAVVLLAAFHITGFAQAGRYDRPEINRYTTIIEHYYSRILEDTVVVSISVPRSWYENPDATYPVAYMLHGYNETHIEWIEWAGSESVLSELNDAGEVQEMILVCPDAGGPKVNEVQNGYYNMEGRPYEDFFFNELMPWVEAKYRIRSQKCWRAVTGNSMGGGGTAGYALHHPELFNVAYPMSAWVSEKGHNSIIDPADRSVNMMRLKKANIANDCIDYVRKANRGQREAISQVHWVVDCGNDDFLLRQDIEFYNMMRDRKIPCELIIRDGTHRWNYWHDSAYNFFRVCQLYFGN
ncbi:MAG: esterase family protein [Bacteroidales bacterium]|nr:esterase family protein [Bacteroidales bacterium]